MIFRIAITFSLALSLSSVATANWTATIVHDPALGGGSNAWAVSETTVYGNTFLPNSGLLPTSWSGGVGLDWNQGRGIVGQLLGTDGFDVVGLASVNGGPLEPILYRGSPANFVRLSNSKISYGRARATWGGIQVGFGRFQGNDQACYWRGTGKSWKNIHPAGYTFSEATTIINNQIGGTAYTSTASVACAWEGTRYRFRVVDSSPSQIDASNASFYGGFRGLKDSNEVAYMWSKTNSAAFNIAPPSSIRSWVTGMDQDKVAITSTSATNFRQAWVYDTFNSISPWTDLQAVLDSQYPGVYSSCTANGIWRDTVNDRIRVVGRASGPSGSFAVLWEYNP